MGWEGGAGERLGGGGHGESHCLVNCIENPTAW